MTQLIRTTSRRHSRWLQACGLAGGLLMAASCSKAPLMAPTGSTLTLLVSRTTAGLNSSVTVTALLYESSGTPVHDGTTVTFFSTLGTLSPAQATTTNGQAAVQLLTGTESGTAEITARSGGTSSSGTATPLVKVTVGAAAVARVELTASPMALPSVGGTTLLTATVSDISGNRLSGIPIAFSTTAGTLDQSGASTDSNGQVQSRLATYVRATITASVGGTSGSVTITLRTPPTASIGVSSVSGFEATLFYTALAGTDGAAVNSVSITFGDGSSQRSLAVGSTQLAAHVYGTLGTFTAVLTVTDVTGETSTASTTLVIVSK